MFLNFRVKIYWFEVQHFWIFKLKYTDVQFDYFLKNEYFWIFAPKPTVYDFELNIFDFRAKIYRGAIW